MKKQNAAFMICIILMIGVLHIPVTHIELSHNREGFVFQRVRTKLNDRISIKYIHSVMKTPVYEHYRIMPDKRMLLTDTEFMSYGAGLPEKNEYDFEMTDKGFRVYNINKPFSFVVYRTAPYHTGASMTLIVNSEEISFLSFSPERTPVKIAVKNEPMWLYLTREVGKWLMNKSM